MHTYIHSYIHTDYIVSNHEEATILSNGRYYQQFVGESAIPGGVPAGQVCDEGQPEAAERLLLPGGQLCPVSASASTGGMQYVFTDDDC